ncbi:MAG: hypothetical protein DVB27_14880 [Verrucomicrobia bacterium]|nr:MAG: hypothetical protein DVB27_14880 [Verrucomicrobiota bacterium]
MKGTQSTFGRLAIAALVPAALVSTASAEIAVKCGDRIILWQEHYRWQAINLSGYIRQVMASLEVNGIDGERSKFQSCPRSSSRARVCPLAGGAGAGSTDAVNDTLDPAKHWARLRHPGWWALVVTLAVFAWAGGREYDYRRAVAEVKMPGRIGIGGPAIRWMSSAGTGARPFGWRRGPTAPGASSLTLLPK